MKITRIIALIIVLSLMMSISMPIKAQEPIIVFYDGEQISFDVNPMIIQGRTLVPMRKIFETFGASVYYDSNTKTITAEKDSTNDGTRKIILKIGDTKATVIHDGVSKQYALDTAATIVQGRTLVPLRFVGEALGTQVNWDGLTRTVSIKTNELSLDIPMSEGNTAANMLNGGYAAIQDEWIYYVNWYDGNRIYKMRTDGTGKTKLNDDWSFGINVVGDWLVYNKYWDHSINIIKTDGSNQKVIVKSGNVVYVKDGWIYVNADVLYKMRIDGSGYMNLTSDYCVSAFVDEDWVYYINFDWNINEGNNGDYIGYLYKVKTDGSGRTKVSNDLISNYIIQDDWIYYTIYNDMRIFKVKKDGTLKTLLINDKAGSINSDGEYLYYSNGNDDWKLYKARIDGSGKTKISDTHSYNINLAGEWVFFTNDDQIAEIRKIHINGSQKSTVLFEYTSDPVIYDDWIYYNNYWDTYRVRINGTNKAMIKESRIDNIVVHNGWMYYTIFSSVDDTGLYKANTDGTGTVKLIEGIAQPYVIIGDWIYYDNDGEGCLWKIRTDGTGNTFFTDHRSRALITDGSNLYYIMNGIYKINSDGSGQTKISNDVPQTGFAVQDGWIYYSLGGFVNEIYKIRTDGSAKTSLGVYADEFKVSGDWIYYTQFLPLHVPATNDIDFILYKIKTDGTGNTKLSNDSTRYLNVVGDWLFYSFVDVHRQAVYMLKNDSSNFQYTR